VAITERQRILQNAQNLIGAEEMAEGLNVSHEEVRAWIEGRSKMPDSKLLALAAMLAKFAAKK
jgi:hypothetical protein